MAYIVGIDLGTTNCAMAFTEAAGAAETPVRLFPVAQLVQGGEVREEPLLPSFLYLPGPAEFAPEALQLPWDEAPQHIVGTLARRRGTENAGRLVSSAKSWLSYGGVDRTAAILPVAGPEGLGKLSPVAASTAYLQHMREAWNSKMEGTPLQEQIVLVTVPASFDAVARELTQHAAEQAGLHGAVLLEEPQAAFYAWLEAHPDWREQVAVGDSILVVDIGGGTTDFTLIAVTEEGGELRLSRVLVGEHILLGGDNMDLALARTIETQLASRNTKLDAMQLHALWQQCRMGKEQLLGGNAETGSVPLTILGRGTGLVGGTTKAELTRDTLHQVLLDGFFPVSAKDEMPAVRRRAGLQEIGLPYAADVAVTRHMAKFLRQGGGGSGEAAGIRRGSGGLACPTHLLFNGGVLQAGLLRERLVSVLNQWLGEEGMNPVRMLAGEDLMHGVARGAAYYGLARAGKGVRIRGGIARTYYVGIETAMPAVPGLPAPMKALTVAPFGMEEGTGHQYPDREFGLMVGEPAEFRFFMSAVRQQDAPGEMLDEVTDELEELAPVEVVLHAEGRGGEIVRVTLETNVTETGVLQLWCVARDGRRWKLEFNVRERVHASE